MSTKQNIETARRMYEAFGHGDVQAILSLVTDDVDWSTDPAVPSAPWYGPRHGKDGVASFLAAIGNTGPVTEFTPLAYAGNEDGDVMVFICPLRLHRDRDRQARRDEHAPLLEVPRRQGLLRPQFRGYGASRRRPDPLRQAPRRHRRLAAGQLFPPGGSGRTPLSRLGPHLASTNFISPTPPRP